MKKKLLSLFLALCMTSSLVPFNVLAAEMDVEDEQDTARNESNMLYSDAELTLTAVNHFAEDSGDHAVTLTRNHADEDATFTVAVYDNSTNYGEDYQILYNGNVIEKIDGASSVYDAFRDNGELTDGLAFDLAVGQAISEAQESAEDETSVSAATALAQLDELDAKAVQFDVTFAAGEYSIDLAIEVLDDEAPEYEETFLMAVLDAEGEMVETAQQIFTIEDNDSPAPCVAVSFDCEPEMELTDDNDAVELTFRRTGDLATTTLVILYVDGQAYGQVDFMPWQEVQTVDGVLEGVYTLTYSNGLRIDGQVEVFDNRTATQSVADGADPILDAIPDEYATIRTPRTGELDDLSWVPGWAMGTEGNNEFQTIYIGSATNNNLFYQGGGGGCKGGVNFFLDDKNFHELTTSGTGSKAASGHWNIDSYAAYDLTGVESIETTVKLTGLDHEAIIKFGIENHSWNEVELDRDVYDAESVHTFVATVYDGKNNDEKLDYRQTSQHVYYSNVDPDGTSRGTNLLVPNALKMNLRQYRFIIAEGASIVDPDEKLTFNGGNDPGQHCPYITEGKETQYMTISSKTYGTNKTVDIAYESAAQYPVELVGYKLYNDSSKKYSDVIPLTSRSGDDSDIGAGVASIVFDADFLKKYEKEYCYLSSTGQVDSDCWTFYIVPVYEKVQVDKDDIEIMDASLGTIHVVESETTYCIGDRIVFEGTGEGAAELYGVWYQAKKTLANTIVDQGTTENHLSTGSPYIYTTLLYPRYTFQGIFSTDANRLILNYPDSSTLHGTIKTVQDNDGTVVTPSQYIIGEYVTLMAKADDGYITRWKKADSKQYFYGNIFYYQLDGNPTHNIIEVDFVPCTMETVQAGIALKQAYAEARLNGTSKWVPMANTTISFTANEMYTFTTDEQGNASIEFKGVPGMYTASVLYEDGVGYVTLDLRGTGTQRVHMPQFPQSVAYPDRVTADVDGTGTTSNMITLSKNNTSAVNVETRVFVPNDACTVSGVNIYFVYEALVDKGVEDSVSTSYPATYKGTDGDYQIWDVQISDTSAISSGMHLYVEVLSKKTIYQNTTSGTTTSTITVSSGLVDAGYDVTTQNEAVTYSVSYDIPSTPTMQDAKGFADLSSINIPVLGKLDFGVSSKTGGFFTQRTDGVNTILTCGHSYLASFGTGTVGEKLQKKQATAQALAKQEEKQAMDGAANADVTAVSGSTAIAKAPTQSKWTFSPAFLFKFTLSPKDDGSSDTYLSRYEMALGVDANYLRNIPFSVYGVPFYVCLTFTTEAYFDIQAEFAKDQNMSMTDVDTDLINDQSATSVNSFIAAPVMKFAVKGGIGYNSFLSLYLGAEVSVPFIIEVYPNVIGAFKLSFTVSGGADLVLFTQTISVTADLDPVGYNQDIIDSLNELKPLATGGTTTIQSTADTPSVYSIEDVNALVDSASFEELFASATFAPMVRTALRRSARNLGSGVVATDVFKNTGIHLLKLDEDNILAFYLKDNGNDETTLNYLTVAYAKSTDGGDTWKEMGFVSDNTKEPNTSLQYDVNLFDLGDRTLVTWSEANFDEVLENLEGVDINTLTPAQISKFMNAMNLKGCFFDEEGEPMGEAFTIAENSTVACGALDAVKNGDMVYVYYQRNIFPYDETDGTITLEELLSTDRTIAMARASVDDTSTWISTTVRATKNGTDKEYRITEVEPFVHDGIMGEILVLDRDGKLAEWNTETESWDPSNEDRQLYLRTYTFDEEDGTPIPSSLLAITDPRYCAQSPQVVSNDDYLHLFWNQNGKIVYLTDFVATFADNADIQEGAYVVADKNGNATTQFDGTYYADDIARDDEHLNIGTTFSAAMDDDGHVLLSWVATDVISEDLTDEIYGVVLETVTNAEAVERSGATYAGNKNLYQLYAKGSPVALTAEESLIGALDSVFLSDDGDSNFLVAFSKLDANIYQEATSADIQTTKSVYKSKLTITDVTAPEYPMPGSDMTVRVTVANDGLGEAKDVAVDATGVGSCPGAIIDSILPGESKTIELTVAVPANFNRDATLTVKASDADSDASQDVDIYYGPYFEIKQMPTMTNIPGTSDYHTETIITNTGNASGVPTLNYEVAIFAHNEVPAKEYTTTVENSVEPGGTVVISYVLEDTPVTTDFTGTLTVSIDTGDKDLGVGQYLYGYLPEMRSLVSKSDLGLDEEPDEPDEPDEPNKPNDPTPIFPIIPVTPTKPGTSGNTSTTPKPDTSDTSDNDKNTADSTKDETTGDTSESETKPSISFSDVAADSWYADAVSWAVEQGITNGTGDGLFSPDLSCTRAQAVTFLWRAAGCPAPTSTEIPFTDVPVDAWYRDAMLWAVEQGITKGTSATTFGPDLECTRVQIVTFIYRFEQANGGGFTGAWAMKLPFTDVPEWAYEAVTWCYMKGITTGTDETTFSPDLACTRAQIVTLLYRYEKN